MENTAPPPASPSKNPQFVSWAVILGIAIVLTAFLFVAGRAAFPPPDYKDFCPNAERSYAIQDEMTCVAAEGEWVPAPAGADEKMLGNCFFEKCQEAYQAASEAHAVKFFAFMVVAGIIAIIAGVLISGSAIVSSGLSYGGVLALVIGSIAYWGDADDLIRLAISGVALLALLYLGWKKFKD